MSHWAFQPTHRAIFRDNWTHPWHSWADGKPAAFYYHILLSHFVFVLQIFQNGLRFVSYFPLVRTEVTPKYRGHRCDYSSNLIPHNDLHSISLWPSWPRLSKNNLIHGRRNKLLVSPSHKQHRCGSHPVSLWQCSTGSAGRTDTPGGTLGSPQGRWQGTHRYNTANRLRDATRKCEKELCQYFLIVLVNPLKIKGHWRNFGLCRKKHWKHFKVFLSAKTFSANCCLLVLAPIYIGK